MLHAITVCSAIQNTSLEFQHNCY